MPTPALAGLAALALVAGPASAEPVAYLFDPAHTRVTWEVLHFGTATMRGRFERVDGHAVLDRAAGRGEVSVRIDTASQSSGVRPLDSRLREADMLAVDAHPTAYFVAQGFVLEGGRPAEVRGEFTLRGVSLPLPLRAERFGCYTHPMHGREVCGGDFVGELRRSRYGFDFGIPFIGDAVRLRVQVEGIRQ